MRKLKLLLTILILLLIETSAVSFIGVSKIVPDLMFAFVTAYAAVEDEFVDNIAVSIVCGVLMSLFNQKGFMYTVILYTYSSLLIYYIYQKKRPFHRWALVLAANTVFGVFANFIYALLMSKSINGSEIIKILVYVVLPMALYNIPAVIIMYNIVKKVFIRKRPRSLVI